MTSVTVVVPMAIRRRGGRKQIIGPDGAPMRASGDVTETQGNPTLVKALARAFRWRRMLEKGRYGSIRELAASEGVDRAYVGRLLNLTLLAPDVVEAILNGRQSEGITLPRQMEGIDKEWAAQRRLLGDAVRLAPEATRSQRARLSAAKHQRRAAKLLPGKGAAP